MSIAITKRASPFAVIKLVLDLEPNRCGVSSRFENRRRRERIKLPGIELLLLANALELSTLWISTSYGSIKMLLLKVLNKRK